MTGPERKRLRLAHHDYSEVGAYFLTVCTRQRAHLFGEIVDNEMRVNELGRVVADCWRSIPRHFPTAELDVFVVMPNHVHGIVWLVRAGHGAPTNGRRAVQGRGDTLGQTADLAAELLRSGRAR